MRKIVLLALVFVGLAAPAAAQDTPRADVFFGYSLVRADSVNFHGANGSVAVNVNDWLGIVGDVSGHSSGIFDTNLVVYTFGPQLTYGRGAKITPFAHALFGGAHASTASVLGGPNVTANGFAMNLGGGLDWNVTHAVGVRLIQADALVTRFSGNSSTDARLSFGVVFRIGGGGRR